MFFEYSEKYSFPDWYRSLTDHEPRCVYRSPWNVILNDCRGLCHHNIDKLNFSQLLFVLKNQWRAWQINVFEYETASPGTQVKLELPIFQKKMFLFISVIRYHIWRRSKIVARSSRGWSKVTLFMPLRLSNIASGGSLIPHRGTG